MAFRGRLSLTIPGSVENYDAMSDADSESTASASLVSPTVSTRPAGARAARELLRHLTIATQYCRNLAELTSHCRCDQAMASDSFLQSDEWQEGLLAGPPPWTNKAKRVSMLAKSRVDKKRGSRSRASTEELEQIGELGPVVQKFQSEPAAHWQSEPATPQEDGVCAWPSEASNATASSRGTLDRKIVAPLWNRRRSRVVPTLSAPPAAPPVESPAASPSASAPPPPEGAPPKASNNLLAASAAKPPDSSTTSASAGLVRPTSPTSHPKGVSSNAAPEVWPIWQPLGAPGQAGPKQKRSITISTKDLPDALKRRQMEMEDATSFSDMVASRSFMGRCIVHPSSAMRVAWDTLSLFVVMYDVLTLPLQVFDIDEYDFVQRLRVVTTTFWSIDIPATFATAYHGTGMEAGVIVGDPWKIAKRYLMRTFVMDLALVVVDWVMLGVKQLGGGSATGGGLVDVARLSKLMRLVRLLRILRLLRVVKFLRISAKLMDMVINFLNFSEGLWEFMGIFKLVFSVVVINHFIACAWYAVGDNEPYEETWIRTLVEEDANKIYRYLVSFHWTISQFTPAPNNYHPQNIKERAFAIGTLLFGFTMFSSFLGSMTTLITQMRNNAMKRSEEDIKVREFLAQNSISVELGNRIVTFLRNSRQDNKRRVLEGDAAALHRLPGSLLTELHRETHQKILDQHPLLLQLFKEHESWGQDLCHEALSQVAVRRGDELFRQGSAAGAAYSIISGTLHYTYSNSSGIHESREKLSQGEWLCEMVLWVRWQHRGTASADLSAVTVARIASENFRVVATRHPEAARSCRRYVEKLTMELSAGSPEERLDTWWTWEIGNILLHSIYQELKAQEELSASSMMLGLRFVGRLRKPGRQRRVSSTNSGG